MWRQYGERRHLSHASLRRLTDMLHTDNSTSSTGSRPARHHHLTGGTPHQETRPRARDGPGVCGRLRTDAYPAARGRIRRGPGPACVMRAQVTSPKRLPQGVETRRRTARRVPGRAPASPEEGHAGTALRYRHDRG